jgi:hypothetical protein
MRGGSLKNIEIVNSDISFSLEEGGINRVGSVVGELRSGKIEDVEVKNSRVSFKRQYIKAGGIAGATNGGELNDVKISGSRIDFVDHYRDVNGTKDYTGGITGDLNSLTSSRELRVVDSLIKGQKRVGGAAGESDQCIYDLTVSGSEIRGTGSVGGVYGIITNEAYCSTSRKDVLTEVIRTELGNADLGGVGQGMGGIAGRIGLGDARPVIANHEVKNLNISSWSMPTGGAVGKMAGGVLSWNVEIDGARLNAPNAAVGSVVGKTVNASTRRGYKSAELVEGVSWKNIVFGDRTEEKVVGETSYEVDSKLDPNTDSLSYGIGETVCQTVRVRPQGSYSNCVSDIDGDGLYEDINGDGKLDRRDHQLLYRKLNSKELSPPNAHRFNFDGENKGVVTKEDVIKLSAQPENFNSIDGFPENSPAPKDLDGDGLYEDVNGDGSFNILDVQVLYDDIQRKQLKVVGSPGLFNFKGSEGDRNNLNILDVQALFNELE